MNALKSELDSKNKELASKAEELTKRESDVFNREAEVTKKDADMNDMQELLKSFPAFDPDNSTEAAVIVTYPISAQERKDLIAMQRSAFQKYNSKQITRAFEDYVKAAEAQPGVNYLAAYWAALSASRLNNHRDDALKWLNRALEINPRYKPAQELKKRLEGTRRR